MRLVRIILLAAAGIVTPLPNFEDFLMIAIAWQFEVRKGSEGEFEQFYGADGDWTAVSRRRCLRHRSVPPTRKPRAKGVAPPIRTPIAVSTIAASRAACPVR